MTTAAEFAERYPNRSKNSMRALQKQRPNEDFWVIVYDYPMGAAEAKAEIAQQRKWARADKSGVRYRLISVS